MFNLGCRIVSIDTFVILFFSSNAFRISNLDLFVCLNLYLFSSLPFLLSVSYVSFVPVQSDEDVLFSTVST